MKFAKIKFVLCPDLQLSAILHHCVSTTKNQVNPKDFLKPKPYLKNIGQISQIEDVVKFDGSW